MNLPDQIQALIDQVKTQKNNLQRNKIISHLEDALAHAKVQDAWVPPSLAETAPAVPGPYTHIAVAPGTNGCICPHGAYDKDCPIHAFLVS